MPCLRVVWCDVTGPQCAVWAYFRHTRITIALLRAYACAILFGQLSLAAYASCLSTDWWGCVISFWDQCRKFRQYCLNINHDVRRTWSGNCILVRNSTVAGPTFAINISLRTKTCTLEISWCFSPSLYTFPTPAPFKRNYPLGQKAWVARVRGKHVIVSWSLEMVEHRDSRVYLELDVIINNVRWRAARREGGAARVKAARCPRSTIALRACYNCVSLAEPNKPECARQLTN